MIKTTRWRPDTCDCELEYQWDDSVEQEKRIHTVSNINKKCSFHLNTSNKQDHYEKILDENSRKNIVYGKLLEITTAVVEEIQEDGSMVKKLKPGLKYNWSFDSDRNLIVDLVGFTQQEKDSLKQVVNLQFGTKVKVK